MKKLLYIVLFLIVVVIVCFLFSTAYRQYVYSANASVIREHIRFVKKEQEWCDNVWQKQNLERRPENTWDLILEALYQTTPTSLYSTRLCHVSISERNPNDEYGTVLILFLHWIEKPLRKHVLRLQNKKTGKIISISLPFNRDNDSDANAGHILFCQEFTYGRRNCPLSRNVEEADEILRDEWEAVLLWKDEQMSNTVPVCALVHDFCDPLQPSQSEAKTGANKR